jgi:F0F1-type ATP synthase beta subunit
MNKGKITAIHGVVVEMEFDKVPGIYEAVEVTTKNSAGDRVVIEVLQQL